MNTWCAGAQIGPYELVASLGAGGMGEVWKARDTRLGRTVAVKRINPQHAERFRQEARAIAALNHPHICQLYDVGPDYLVMEYVEGVPLRGPLPVEEALPLALQLASALDAAHRQGIVHRDLKPANILLTSDGIKLLDFGLAKWQEAAAGDALTRDANLTKTGVVVGTVAYMSPEQAQGQAVDIRSDIFSFGIVLYEMLSGKRPFAGDTPMATLSAIIKDEPSPLAGYPALERILRRCLEKQPAERFQTIAEAKAALEASSQSSERHQRQPSIAVLPFVNMSRDPDDEYFSDGLAEEVINALTKIPGLKVIARTSAFAFKGKNQDIREIAQNLDVNNVLEGSVRRAGNRVRITAQLITAADGSHLWSERYDRQLADIFAIQDEIAQSIMAALRIKLIGKTVQYQPKFPAYEALLRGRHHLQSLTSEGLNRAKGCFEEAIRLDPNYAAPHLELAGTYLLFATNTVHTMRDIAPNLRAEALRALELDPEDHSGHSVLGALAAAHDYDWVKSAEHFGKAMSGGSISADIRGRYARLWLAPMARFSESVEEMQLSVEQDPLDLARRSILASHLNACERYDRSLTELNKVLELDENYWVANYLLAETYLLTGQLPQALAAAEKAYRVHPSHSMNWGLLAALLTRTGDRDRAAALVRAGGDAPRPAYGRFLYHLLCSEIDEAAAWYEVMIERREPFAIIYARYPIVKPLRESRHWPRLAGLMNLPTDV